MNRTFSAIIFDCIGVVVDCNFHQFVAWKRLSEEEGVPFTMADYQSKVSGRTREAGIRAMMGNVGQEKIRELSLRKQKIFEKLIAIDPPSPFPGIADLLTVLRAHNVALAVTSSSRNARALLTAAHLDSFFNVIATLPEKNHLFSTFSEKSLYIDAIQRLGRGAKECIVVEDSPLSIKEVKKLGVFVVGLTIITVPEALRDADRVVTGHEALRTLLLRLVS